MWLAQLDSHATRDNHCEQGICHHIMRRDFGNPTLTEGGVVGWAAPQVLNITEDGEDWLRLGFKGLSSGPGMKRYISPVESRDFKVVRD